MAIINQYEPTVTPSQPTLSTIGAESFQKEASYVGRAFDVAANEIRAADKEIGRIDKVRQVTEMTVNAIKDLYDARDAVTKGDDFSAYEANWKQAVNDIYSRYVENIQDPDVRNAFTTHFAQSALSGLVEVRSESRRKTIDASRAAVVSAIEEASNLSFRAKNEVDKKQIEDSVGAIVSNAVSGGMLTDSDASKLLESFREKTQIAEVKQMVMVRPSEALAALKKPEMFPNIDPLVRLQLMQSAQSAIEHQAAMAERARREAAAQYQGLFESNLKSLENTGKPVLSESDLSAMFKRIDPALAMKWSQAFSLAQAQHTAYSIALASPDKVQDILGSPPEGGSPDYASRLAEYQAKANGVAEALKVIKNDPAATVAESAAKAVDSVPDVASLPQEQKFGLQLAQRVELLKASGKPVLPLTNAEAAEIKKRIEAGDPDIVLQTLREISSWGDDIAAQAVSQLKLPVLALTATALTRNAIDDKGAREVVSALIAANKGKITTNETTSERIQAAVNRALPDFRLVTSMARSMGVTGDAGALGSLVNWKEGLSTLATYFSAAYGLDEKEAVSRATDTLSSAFTVVDSDDMHIATLKSEGEAGDISEALKDARERYSQSIDAPKGERQSQRYREDIAKAGVWVSDPKDVRFAVLFNPLNGRAVTINGKAVRVQISKEVSMYNMLKETERESTFGGLGQGLLP